MTALNTALTLAWMLSLIVIPVLVFLKTRMPRSASAQQVISDYDAQLASIEATCRPIAPLFPPCHLDVMACENASQAISMGAHALIN
ncbi:hypothetical protein [Delftia acidovorans]|uniref:Uncharacterized protein n=1 Tax=Delftia acidovorans TaxID=80866 RepID=A0AAJ2QXA6_DELAC|nr:hypothetical protein [Delftia acidovorans]MDX4953734.1 hypothetical protein [Delftia acidovorans]